MDDSDRCYASALRILRHRFNSIAELKRKLRSKGFSKEDIDPTIQRLAAEKWLDDERETAIRTAQRRLPILIRRYGEQAARNKLTAYLLKQGYEAALVRDIVKEIKVAHD